MQLEFKEIWAIVVGFTGELLLGLLLFVAVKWSTESPSRYEIISTSLRTFLLDTSNGGTWKWFVKRDDDDLVDMGWQYHAKSVRHDTATDPEPE